MYQFTTTTVINSSLDSNGVTAKYSGSSSAFKVTRVGTFLKDKIVAVYKRPYTAGVKEILGITVPTLTGGKAARLEVKIRLSQATDTEFASSYLYFEKPVIVEIIATGTANTDAAAFVTKFNSLKNRFGSSYATVSASGADLTFTAKEPYMVFESVIISEETANSNSITQVDYVSKATGTVSTAGKIGFGDDNWMVRAVSVPTLDNTRYYGINKEERPVLGGNYTEYVLHYTVEKDHDYGIVSGLVSKTVHVFYVLSTLVSGFEAALIDTGIAVDTVGTAVTATSITSGTLDISEVATQDYQITYTTTPAGVTGALFTLNSTASTVAGTADWTKVSVSYGGLIEIGASHGLAAGDKIAVDMVIDGYSVTKEITLA